jgi:hypothetical protein
MNRFPKVLALGCALLFPGIAASADDLTLSLVSMYQSGGGITEKPIAPLLLLPSKGVTKLDDPEVANLFLLVKNNSSTRTIVLTEPSARITVTLFSYSPTIAEVKDLPKEMSYEFRPRFSHQPAEYALKPGGCRIYEINFFKNKKMVESAIDWLWVTGISKVKIKCIFNSESGTLGVETQWMPVAVEVPQFNSSDAK